MGAVPNKKHLSALDRSFLVAEGRDVMMHVGGLLELSATEWASPDLPRQLRDELADPDLKVEEPWNMRLSHPDLLKNPMQSWVPDPSFALENHVRRWALPAPGDERELGILVSRLHSTPLDFHRPPWEVNYIEGLRTEGRRRIAVYLKVHHCLLDGYTGMRMMARGLSTDPKDADTPLFFALPPEAPRSRRGAGERRDKKENRLRDEDEGDENANERAPALEALALAARTQIGVAKDIGHALVDVVRARRGDGHGLVLPLQAPRCVLNQRITRSRRFATQRVAVERAKRIAAKTPGATVNDVVLAICGIALRRFLLEQGDLPERPLIALVPVNVRPKGDPGGGNAVGGILSTLATDIDEPRRSLEAIVASTRPAKARLRGMSRDAIVQYTALLLAPAALSFIPGARERVSPVFNVVISNVRGPPVPLYFRGWRLEESYPLSIPFHNYALNITLQSYAGLLDFGFIGCSDTIPHLQRLAVYAGEAVNALEA